MKYVGVFYGRYGRIFEIFDNLEDLKTWKKELAEDWWALIFHPDLYPPLQLADETEVDNFYRGNPNIDFKVLTIMENERG